MTEALPRLDAGFKLLNRWLVVPVLRAGLGSLLSTPLTGSILLLRTTGRSSGRIREAPLGYVIRDGAIYCCAGFGTGTAWYANLVADPNVEVLLPSGIAVAGHAETVTEPGEWSRVFPAYTAALGSVGRATLGDLRDASPERLAAIREGLPLVRIRATGLAGGPADPGGWGWTIVQAAVAIVVVGALRSVLRRRRPAT